MPLTNRQLFLTHLAQTSPFPLMVEVDRAEGIYMYGSDGKRITDLISGIGVSNIGHRHPRVIKAIQDQLEKYLHLMVYGEFVQAPQVKLAEKLTATLPEPLSSVYFVNSGSEAVEGAVKLAKKYTGRFEIISFRNAYHGSTQGALSLNSSETQKRNFRPLIPGIVHLDYDSIPALSGITEHTAAVIVESVQGEAGVRVPSRQFLVELEKRCRSCGTLLIIDEIQTGFGRTGKFWAFQHFDIVPDIVLTAKGMAGGMPLGAFIASKEIMHALSEDPVLGHITTFGGHPVSCAASLACLEVILEENLIDAVEEKEALFREKLVHPAIREIRSKGLLMALEFESFEVLKPVIDRALGKGVLTDWFLFCSNSLRIAPPLTISTEQVEEACEVLLQAITEK